MAELFCKASILWMLVSVVASLVRERVNPVKAPAVAAVSQVKDVVYSLWFKLKLAVGSVNDDHLTGKPPASIQSTPLPVEERTCPDVPASLFTSYNAPVNLILPEI